MVKVMVNIIVVDLVNIIVIDIQIIIVIDILILISNLIVTYTLINNNNHYNLLYQVKLINHLITKTYYTLITSHPH